MNVSFSRAITSWSGVWSGGQFIVTASPQAQSHTFDKIYQATDAVYGVKWNGNTATGNMVYTPDGAGAAVVIPTGATFTVDATGRYNQGWKDAAGMVELPPERSEPTASTTLMVPHSTNVGQKASYQYVVTVDNSWAYLSQQVLGADNKVVARASTSGVYTAGQDSIYIKTDWGTGTTANLMKLSKTTKSSEGSKNPTHTITSSASSTYNTSSHKYDITHYGIVDGVNRHYSTVSTGTEAYEAGVNDSTVSGSWSNGTYTAVNSKNNNRKATTAIFDTRSTDISWSGNTAKVKVYASNDGAVTYTNTGKTLSIDAQVRYDAGRTKGRDDVTIGSVTWGDVSGKTISVTVPTKGRDTEYEVTYEYILTEDGWSRDASAKTATLNVKFSSRRTKPTATSQSKRGVISLDASGIYRQGYTDGGGGAGTETHTHSVTLTQQFSKLTKDGFEARGTMGYYNEQTKTFVSTGKTGYWYYSSTNLTSQNQGEKTLYY